MQGKRGKAGNTSRDSPGVWGWSWAGWVFWCQGLHQGVSCPVKTLLWKELEGLPGAVGTAREYLTGGSYPSITPPWTGREMPAGPVRDVAQAELEGQDRPSTAGELWHGWHDPGVWQGKCTKVSNIPRYQMYQCTQYPAGCDTSASCSLQCWGTTETWTKEGQENLVRRMIRVKFLPNWKMLFRKFTTNWDQRFLQTCLDLVLPLKSGNNTCPWPE